MGEGKRRRGFSLSPGTIILHQKIKIEVVTKIGEGACALVYLCLVHLPEGKGTNKAALKIEKEPKSGNLDKEIPILAALRGKQCIPNYLCEGYHEDHRYVLMHNSGINLFLVRQAVSQSPNKSLHQDLVMALGACLIQDIECMHNEGYLHRDIKAANILLDLDYNQRRFYVRLIDIGLAKKYMKNDRHYRQEEPNPLAKFRGTTSYASINAHNGEDLSRRDDLWSLFYVLVEILTGTLPWRTSDGKCLPGKEDVKRLKEQAWINSRMFTGGSLALPEAFQIMFEHCKELEFDAKPDYAKLCAAFHKETNLIVESRMESSGQHIMKYGIVANDLQIRTYSALVEKEQQHAQPGVQERLPERRSAGLPAPSYAQNNRENSTQVMKFLPIPRESLGYMIGGSGRHLHDMETQFGINIIKVDRGFAGEPCGFEVRGYERDVDNAMKVMQSKIHQHMMKEQAKEEERRRTHAVAYNMPYPNHNMPIPHQHIHDRWQMASRSPTKSPLHVNARFAKAGPVGLSSEMHESKKVAMGVQIEQEKTIKKPQEVNGHLTGEKKPSLSNESEKPTLIVPMRIPENAFEMERKRKLDAEELEFNEGKTLIRYKQAFLALGQPDQFAIMSEVIHQWAGKGKIMKRLLLELDVVIHDAILKDL